MSIDEILDELEGLLLDAARVPFTNKRVLEEDDIAQLLDHLRESLPSEIVEAKRIMSERQRILDEAQREAQHIVDQAKNYISKLTDENVITKQAQEYAGEIMNQAKQDAQHLQQDAVHYADEVFNHLEAHLERALDVVRQGHVDLHQSTKKQESVPRATNEN